MNLIGLFFLGFISAFVGTSPPGLLNISAVKVNLKEGKRAALWFVTGAVLIIFLQTFVALLFARVIDKNESLLLILREMGCLVFALLTIYFLCIAKKSKLTQSNIKQYSNSSRFFLGMLLSALNLFPIPYYVLLGVTFASYQLFAFDLVSIFIFVIGAVSAAFLVFYGYVVFFNRIESKAHFFIKNMNSIIGIITGLVTLVTFWNIISHYRLHCF